jgi:cytochrome c oxidase subunit 2
MGAFRIREHSHTRTQAAPGVVRDDFGVQSMMQARYVRWVLAALAALPALAMAQAADPHRWQLNMGKGVTHTSRIAYESHMLVLWICVVIGVIVFGAMAYALFKFRKSKGAVAAQFSHNTVAEIIWTVIPVLILVGLAWPATKNLINMYDTRNSEMTVKVTGYQWMWKYEYLGEDVSFTSRLDRKSDQLRQDGKTVTAADHPHYLLDVDNQLVLPVGTKVRFVITADDVIHAWWVPALGWKQDAIPGIVNEAWASIDEPGIYRGQCAELCGKDHGFMPIVVKAVPKPEYERWLAAEKAKASMPAAPAVPAAAPVEAAPTEAAPSDAEPAEAATAAVASTPASAG